MKLGELFDKLKDLERAVFDVESAERDLEFFGSPETNRRKHATLLKAKERVQALRDEEVGVQNG